MLVELQKRPEIDVELNIPQNKFLQMPHKFRAFVAGYGSSKTVSGCLAICQHFHEHPRINSGYFAPTYPHIRDIFYPTIEEVAEWMGFRIKINTSDKEVHFFSGQRYFGTSICRSMDNPAMIIGFKIGHAFIDELDVLPVNKARMAWRKIIARMRWQQNTSAQGKIIQLSPPADLRNGIDIATTPEGFKFCYELFVEAPRLKPELLKNYGLIQASTYDNEANLPEDYIPSLIEAYPAELIDAYVDGQFVNLTSGTVYRCYKREKHRSKEMIISTKDHKDQLNIGMDFNVGEMAATIFVKRKNGWHAVSELKKVFDTPDMIKIIQDRWQKEGHKIIIYPDASGKNRKSSNASESDIALLTQAGFTIKVNSSNPAVKDRVMSVNKQFESGNLWVNDQECPIVAKCLEQQAYDTNGEPDKTTGFDHQNDSVGYPIVFEFPIKRKYIIGKTALEGYYG